MTAQGLNFTASFTSTSSNVFRDEEKHLENVSKEVADDILKRAVMNAPKASGALARSGKVVKSSGGGYTVTFGNNSVKYAYIRHVKNNKNPQTTLYLEKAAETVSRGNLGKYLR